VRGLPAHPEFCFDPRQKVAVAEGFLLRDEITTDLLVVDSVSLIRNFMAVTFSSATNSRAKALGDISCSGLPVRAAAADHTAADSFSFSK